jgi:hypothetical protein
VIATLVAAPLAATDTMTPSVTNVVEGRFGVMLRAHRSGNGPQPDWVWSSRRNAPGAEDEPNTLTPREEAGARLFNAPAGSAGATYLVEATDPDNKAACVTARIDVITQAEADAARLSHEGALLSESIICGS